MKNERKVKRFKTGYIDESGDNGENGTKYLVLTYISLLKPKKVSRLLKKIKFELRKTKKGRSWLRKNNNEIKFAKFPNKILRLKLIEDLSKLIDEIYCIVIEKNNSKIFYEEKRHVLFYFVEDSLIKENPLINSIILDNHFLKIEKTNYLFFRKYKEINLQTNKEEEIEDIILSKYRETGVKSITLREEDSKSYNGLQVADLISGAIFQEFEFKNKKYTDLIKINNKINIKIRKIIK